MQSFVFLFQMQFRFSKHIYLIFVFVSFSSGFISGQNDNPAAQQVQQSDEERQAYNQQCNQAFKTILKTNTTAAYQNFLKNYPECNSIGAAEDSLFAIASRKEDLKLLRFCIDNFKGQKRSKVLRLYYDIYTSDGETQSLDDFYKTFGNEIPIKIKTKDFEIARLGNRLMLHLPYTEWKFTKYDEYIRQAAPREKAFVALQRLISNDISARNWAQAIKKVKSYAHYFGTNNKKINDLLYLLTEKWNNYVKINSVGKGINTEDAGEYSPVISGNEELLYFCGIRRKDNIGGEDIFVSRKGSEGWGKAKIVPELSSKLSNEAPVSISSDGNTIMLFKSGKLFYSQKTSTGWSKAFEFPKPINGDGWQLDGMLTSDGKGLLFSSTRAGGYNHFNSLQKYHGDELYPSDIYISLKTADNRWGDPINLGPLINSPYCERTPFLHADMKTLYFSSDGHGGMGKLDVFKSTRLADSCWTCWSEPVNLGKEINTELSDVGYKITTSGDKAYFSYERRSNYDSSILLLLDVSSSMSGSKLRALKEATKMVSQSAIQNNSEIAILTFANECKSPITDSCGFSRDFNPVMEFVEKIKTGGGTPTFEAYDYACKFINRNADPNSKNKVIVLLSDGDANGCTALDSMLLRVKKAGMLYKTQTILYDFSDNSEAYSDLQKIASFTNGKFYSTKLYDDLGSAFEAANNDILNFSLTGDKDIYWINLPRNLRPDYVSTISGKLVAKDNKPIAAEVKWDDLQTGKNMGVATSDPIDGSYFIALPTGKIYGYYAEKDSYLSVSQNIDLRGSTKTTHAKENLDMISLKQLVESGNAIKVNNIFFDFAKWDLLSYSYSELDRLARFIISKKIKVELSGHTDNISSAETNQVLSEKRANAVKEYLITKGCSADQLISMGYGKTKPCASNKTENGRAKNRRVELRIIK